ncbi:227_t:CDS:2 [Gigaspora margarita]|uniref:227_t:CDS:1 n=1 Tax=Gigaspora margarita TaxID=4874 RepID=A0ABN7UXE5_GIGMA|nr:227_t:CDS:2 [Gigaspora margarita]
MEEETYQQLIQYFTELNILAKYNKEQIQKFKSQARHYITQEGILYRANICNTTKGNLSCIGSIAQKCYWRTFRRKSDHSKGQNLSAYLQDLNRRELGNLVLLFESPGEDWDKKLAYACQEILNLNTQRKPNSQILEAYYKLGALLAKKGEGYLYVVEHINITILEKMYNEDFLDILLVEAHAQR